MPQPQPTSIRLPPDLKRDLKAIAVSRRWDLAPTMIYALTEWTRFQLQQLRKTK